MDEKLIAEIKNKLQLPKTVLDLIAIKEIKGGEVSKELVEDSIKVIDEIVKLLNKLAKWEE